MARSDRPLVLVLGAGRGARMGGPKALMMVAGRPWWRWQSERLREIDAEPLWVVSPFVREQIEGESLRLVTVERDDAPMWASLCAGARASSGRALFVLPVDVPAPARAVWTHLENGTLPGGVSVPERDGVHGHPVFLSKEWVGAELIPRLDGPEQRLDHLTADVRRMIPVADASACVNLNTPRDLEAWLLSGERGGWSGR